MAATLDKKFFRVITDSSIVLTVFVKFLLSSALIDTSSEILFIPFSIFCRKDVPEPNEIFEIVSTVFFITFRIFSIIPRFCFNFSRE